MLAVLNDLAWMLAVRVPVSNFKGKGAERSCWFK